MHLADHVKPISYLKRNAAQIVKDLTDSGEPLIITQNGEAKLVVQDVRSYESTQQTLALLKILPSAKSRSRARTTLRVTYSLQSSTTSTARKSFASAWLQAQPMI